MKLYVSDMHIGSGNQKDDFVYDAKFIELLDKYEDQITEFFIVGDFLELMHVKDKKILCETVQECMDLFDHEILNKIYNAHTALFDRLKKLSSKVRIRYIAGNHDYHVLFSEKIRQKVFSMTCLLYTSDAADDLLCVDLGGRRIIKKKKKTQYNVCVQLNRQLLIYT